MTLKEWMKMKDLKDAEVAEMADMDRTYITHLRNGTRNPSVGAILRLENVTKGDVRFADWVRK